VNISLDCDFHDDYAQWATATSAGQCQRCGENVVAGTRVYVRPLIDDVQCWECGQKAERYDREFDPAFYAELDEKRGIRDYRLIHAVPEPPYRELDEAILDEAANQAYRCLINDLQENGYTLERALEENLVTYDEAMLHYEDLLEHGVEFSNTPEERAAWKGAFDAAYREYAEQVRAARAAAFVED
jgi:hypothetical protein